MKRFQTDKLLDDLKADVQSLLACAAFFKQNTNALLKQPAPEKWSVAQTLEHLNRFGRHYLKAINQAISVTNTEAKRSAWYTPGWLGNYATNMIRPKDLFQIKSKMKTPKGYNPDNQLNASEVLDEFVQQQQTLLQLLETAKQRDLNTIRIPISITKLITLNLGDTFRFLIAHEQRHMIQARNALHDAGVATDKFPVILQAIPQ